jgi:hypothetical protein
MKLPKTARFLLVIASALIISACSTDGPYLGKTTPPTEQRLVYANGEEPESFDPAKYAGGTEMRIINVLFDGLTKFHPITLEPMAALATHYEANADQTQFTFYLRGHPNPRGIKLPNTDTLRQEFEAGRIMDAYPPDGATEPSSPRAILFTPGEGCWIPKPPLGMPTSFTTSVTLKTSTWAGASLRI